MKPILFNTEMVRATMDGRKTVTRRVVKPQPKSKLVYVCMGYKYGTWGYPGEKTWEYWKDESFRLPDGLSSLELNQHWTPPCHTGDILYVRETWAVWSKMEGIVPEIHYKADGECLKDVKWRPSIHMPREVARLFLRVKSVRVERLQTPFFELGSAIFVLQKEGIDIGGQCQECIASYGQPCCIDEDGECGILDDVRGGFSEIWDSTIKKTDIPIYGWNADPWVWVIEFERIAREEALE